ncbi:MAG: alpha/beta fold hydrolase [Alphaproteobacteria bacterium]|nr:alpha/beta fold hydrolase [Alphaproteobacteria bacterium]
MERIRVKVAGHEVVAFSEGNGKDVMLAVHGGPGVPCNYLRDAHLCYAEHGFRVVSWDQLGCGESDRPDDPALWTAARYVEEVETVREALDLGKVYIVGNSWGGILGIEYCLKYQRNVHAFVCGNIGPSMPLIQDGFRRCKANLGHDTVRMMALRESEGTTSHPEYLAAQTLLMYRHMCRLDEWPAPVKASFEPSALGMGPLKAMFGWHLFNFTGNLRDWDRTNDLTKITVPMMVTASEFDYVLPEYCEVIRQIVPGCEYAMFRNSGHMPFWDAAEAYHAKVGAFLAKHRKR